MGYERRHMPENRETRQQGQRGLPSSSMVQRARCPGPRQLAEEIGQDAKGRGSKEVGRGSNDGSHAVDGAQRAQA